MRLIVAKAELPQVDEALLESVARRLCCYGYGIQYPAALPFRLRVRSVKGALSVEASALRGLESKFRPAILARFLSEAFLPVVERFITSKEVKA